MHGGRGAASRARPSLGRLAELADAADSKSADPTGSSGFDPRAGHQLSFHVTTRRTIAVGLLVGIVSGLAVEVIKGFPFLRWAAAASSTAMLWLSAPVVVGRWAVILFWGLLAMIVVGTAVAAVSSWRHRSSEPDWVSYCADEFLGVQWRWGYIGHTLATSTLTPYCPQCACQMVAAREQGYNAAPETKIA